MRNPVGSGENGTEDTSPIYRQMIKEFGNPSQDIDDIIYEEDDK